MSADEIRRLAKRASVDGMAFHHAGLLKTKLKCKQYAAALLDEGIFDSDFKRDWEDYK